MGSTSTSTHDEKYAFSILFTRVALFTSGTHVPVVYTQELVFEISFQPIDKQVAVL